MTDPIPFHSPLRATLSCGRPGYPAMAPIATLPGLVVTPEPHGFRISAWLCRSRNEASEFKCYRASAAEAVEVLQAYALDPEGTMVALLGFPGFREARPAPPSAKAFSLEDLGLL